MLKGAYIFLINNLNTIYNINKNAQLIINTDFLKIYTTTTKNNISRQEKLTALILSPLVLNICISNIFIQI